MIAPKNFIKRCIEEDRIEDIIEEQMHASGFGRVIEKAFTVLWCHNDWSIDGDLIGV